MKETSNSLVLAKEQESSPLLNPLLKGKGIVVKQVLICSKFLYIYEMTIIER